MTDTTPQTEGPQPYTGLARALHWLVAILVLCMIPAGVVMVQEGLPRPLQNTLFIFHKNFGVIVLLLMLLRLMWRAVHPAPPLPPSIPEWQRRIASVSHMALYGLAILVPIAGYVRVKAGGFPIELLDATGLPALVPRSDALASAAQSIHYFGGLALAALLLLHIAAALQHAVFKRDGVFARMWPPIGRSRS